MTILNDTISDLIKRNALFVVNHSGGKDSQAMLVEIRKIVPVEQILVVHADLPGVEWEGTFAKVVETSKGLKVVRVTAVKTFEDMVLHRGFWPSPSYRQCTSDLKRGPIERAIRQHLKAVGHSGLVVNCMGLRADESCNRAKATPFKLNEGNSKAGREWYDWLPIHGMTEAEVFSTIAEAGQEVHWAYKAGMSRLSCVFCIMASGKDLKTAANLNPEMYAKFVAMEQAIDQTFVMPAKGKARKFLPEVTGVEPDVRLVDLHLARMGQKAAA